MTTNREVFDQIAESWYRVRHWPLLKEELEELAARWQSGKLLNVGCAHGPDFLPFSQGFELWGVDSSPAMLKQALKYSVKFKLYVNLMATDALFLPFPASVADVMRVADSGRVMPQKSTWFGPKLPSGLVIRTIDWRKS